MGFTMHFYIIFGTNLLTQSPVPLPIFPLFQCFEEKEYQTESKRNEINWRSYFWNESHQIDLDSTSGDTGGAHEGGPPLGRAPCLVGPLVLLQHTSSSYIYPYTLETSYTEPKPYFHRRNLLYPWDPILGPFPALHRRGHWSWRASTSTP